jgi:hypothetical protein
MPAREFRFGNYLTRRIETVPEGPIEAKEIFEWLAKMYNLTWQEGDEFWEYNTPEAMWKRDQGEAGYAWYRNGAFLTGMPTMTWRVEDCLTTRIEPTSILVANLERQSGFLDSSAALTWQEGDEFWEFSSPPRTWAHLHGRAGIAWIRNGKAMYVSVSTMN